MLHYFSIQTWSKACKYNEYFEQNSFPLYYYYECQCQFPLKYTVNIPVEFQSCMSVLIHFVLQLKIVKAGYPKGTHVCAHEDTTCIIIQDHAVDSQRRRPQPNNGKGLKESQPKSRKRYQ